MSILDLTEKIKKLFQSANPVSNFKRGVEAIQDFKTDFPANKAYVKRKIHQKIAPNIPIDNRTLEKPTKPVYDFSRSPVKSGSASLEPFSISSNKSLERLKKTVISNEGYRPAMQRFLSTVPVYDFPGGEGVPAGITSNYKGQPNIGLSTTNKQSLFIQPRHREVMKHELAHTAPRPKEYEKSFRTFFEGVDEKTNPMLYQTGQKYYNDGRPPPNEEEFYATLAQSIGPKVLDIPEIRKYYINLFK